MSEQDKPHDPRRRQQTVSTPWERVLITALFLGAAVAITWMLTQ